MTNSICICGNRAPRKSRPAWHLVVTRVLISVMVLCAMAVLFVALGALLIWAGATWRVMVDSNILVGLLLLVISSHLDGVYHRNQELAIGLSVAWLLFAVFATCITPPRFIRSYDRGYERFPLTRPTAALTQAIRHDPRWTGLRAVRGFRVMIRHHTIQGVLHAGGGPYSFSLGKRHPHQVASWIQAFPPHDVPCQFAIERIDGRYNVYFMPHERGWFRYSPTFVHGMLVTMTKALAVYRASRQRQEAHQQRVATNAHSWATR